jgi:large subunit ribosomal protein L30
MRVKQIRSGIGAPSKHKRILRALGLGKMHRVVELPDVPSVRGMVEKIPHLAAIVEAPAASSGKED